ncbi:MAG: GerMN domain-containing protein [Thermoleophilia bacterium]
MNRNTNIFILTLALGTAALALLGCGYGSQVKDGGSVTTVLGADATPSTTVAPGDGVDATTSTTAGETTQLSVYFTYNEHVQAVHRQVPTTKAVAAAALQALLEGPTPEEAALGVFSAIPKGTLQLGVDIKDGVATVDLSREYESGGGSLSMGLRLAQVVYTLTQFPTVNSVQFKLDGKPVEVFGGEGFILDHPVGRADYEDSLTPAILVESPTIGDTVTSPLHIYGTSNVFEGTSQVRLVDQNGKTIVEQYVTATSGTGTRGTWEVTVPFQADPGSTITLSTFEYSAKDGSMVNITEIPLHVAR